MDALLVGGEMTRIGGLEVTLSTAVPDSAMDRTLVLVQCVPVAEHFTAIWAFKMDRITN